LIDLLKLTTEKLSMVGQKLLLPTRSCGVCSHPGHLIKLMLCWSFDEVDACVGQYIRTAGMMSKG
jgi:hypothetical protein